MVGRNEHAQPSVEAASGSWSTLIGRSRKSIDSSWTRKIKADNGSRFTAGKLQCNRVRFTARLEPRTGRVLPSGYSAMV